MTSLWGKLRRLWKLHNIEANPLGKMSICVSNSHSKTYTPSVALGIAQCPAASGPNNPLELTAHSAGFVGYSWRFFLWAAAQCGR
jgi:hypothetical protein